jgi:hypothetical protein
VRRRSGGGWRVRLVETGGALAAAEIVPTIPLTPPGIGRRIAFHGRLRYDEEHRWYTVDPVEAWHEAPLTAAADEHRA